MEELVNQLEPLECIALHCAMAHGHNNGEPIASTPGYEKISHQCTADDGRIPEPELIEFMKLTLIRYNKYRIEQGIQPMSMPPF